MNGLVEWVSQPSIKIEMQSNTVNGKCSQWKNNILFKNETEKNCVITSERFTQIIVKFETENFFCTFSIIHQTSFWGARNFVRQIWFSTTLKRKELESLYFPELDMFYK